MPIIRAFGVLASISILVSGSQLEDQCGRCNATEQVAFPIHWARGKLPRSPILLQIELHSQPAARSGVNSSRVGSVANLTDKMVAAHIKQLSRSPLNVAGVIQSGLQAILNSVVHFSAQPPRIAEGIAQLGEDLFECVEKLLSEEHKAAEEFKMFKNAWYAGFVSLPGMADSITADIDRFVRDGDAPPLIRAIGSIINEAGVIVSNFLLPETGVEVIKYLNAVDAAFVTLGSSWDEFAQGNTVQGIEEIYWGLRTITDGLMPEVLKDNEIYNTIISTLDFVIGNLSTHVLEYERRIMEAQVCWRTEKNRDRERPMQCPPNYFWDGAGYCYPMMGLLEAGSSSRTFDSTLQAKGGDSGGGGGHYVPGPNAIPARCDVDGYFSEKHGSYCYTPCGPGFQQKAETYTRCISACEGNFSGETPMMCGRDSGIITKAILEMVTTILNSAFSLADNIMKMKEHGVDAETLTATIQVFIDMGKPFANPTCPVPEEVQNAPARGRSWPQSASASSLPSRVDCSMGETLFFSSHRGAQLQDNYGSAYLSWNARSWEQWRLSDAGNGKVFISSHRSAQLSDHNGHVGLSSNKQGWEKWTLFDAGDGNVFIRSHRFQNLQDHHGQIRLSWNALGWEKWMVKDASGKPACQVQTTTTTTMTASTTDTPEYMSLIRRASAR